MPWKNSLTYKLEKDKKLNFAWKHWLTPVLYHVWDNKKYIQKLVTWILSIIFLIILIFIFISLIMFYALEILSL